MHKSSERNSFTLFVFSCIMIFPCSYRASGQGSLIKEETRSILTYPYSDPNPVPSMAINSMVSAFYPYFVFDGYTDQGIRKDWKVITLENEFINVTILPEVGGKVWGAIEKSTGREFIYQNHVLKFRAIGIRGPWTSGGIEHNFGLDLGHAPNWPENLGAGKPYEPDTRFQDYISAYCYTQLRDQKLADNYTGKIINYSQKNWGNAMDPANTFIANQVFNDLGKQKEAIFAMEN